MVRFLEDKAREFGDRTALLFNPAFRYQRWSYADLWEGAGQVAALLQERGLEKGDRVLLWGPNCPQWVVAFFGCLRAGVIVVPLDLRSNADFVQRVASKTRPKLSFVSRLTPQDRGHLGLLEALCQGLPPARQVDVASDDLAEIMFTSGTTGDPKGVMLTHANLLANLESINQRIPGKTSDRLVSILPLSHMLRIAP